LLVSLGVPPELVDRLRQATEEELLQLLIGDDSHPPLLPETVGNHLIRLMNGEAVTPAERCLERELRPGRLLGVADEGGFGRPAGP